MIAYFLGKLARPVLVVSAWALAIATPAVASRFGLFNFLLIEGRCVTPSLAACGQDNASLAYTGIFLLAGVFAGIVTWAAAMWDEWKEEYEAGEKESKPKEPERTDWR